MNITQFKKVFPSLIKNRVVPFLHGNQGVGKTETIEALAVENGMELVHLHLATQEPGDILGLLVQGPNGTVTHSRPEWFPTSGRGIVFLDELPRAKPEVLQCMFNFITKGMIHRHLLPTGWVVVAAGNYQNNNFNQTEFDDAAWNSRFCHIDFRPTQEEFIQYCESRIQTNLASFTRKHPELIEDKINEGFDFKIVRPNRRALSKWIAPLDLEPIDETRYEVYSGLVGPITAQTYIQHCKNGEMVLGVKDILHNYKVNRKTIQKYSKSNDSRFDILGKLGDELIHQLNTRVLQENEMNNLKLFLLDIPLELGLKMFNQMSNINQCVSVLNDMEFVKLLKGKIGK
jgi:hypothetical protein